jgi:phosphoribosylglycinamide formyltransferase-1
MTAPMKLVAMASGGGRTVLNVLEHIQRGDLQGVSLEDVFVSRPDAAAAKRCADKGLRVHTPDGDPDAGAEAFLKAATPDMVLLCGYLRHLTIAPHLTDRILNIHPSLLPDFGGQGMYGNRVHAAVLKSQCNETGCTVHLVDDAYDSGPVVLQRTCKVFSNDTVETLGARVFELECEALPDAVRLAAQHRLRRTNGRIDIAPDHTPWPEPLFPVA